MQRAGRFAAAWALILCGCGAGARSSAPPPATEVGPEQPAATQTAPPTEPPPDQDDSPSAVLDGAPALSALLRRDPRGDGRCPAPFGSFWEWPPPCGDVDSPPLQRIIWLDPAASSGVPVVAGPHPRADEARCIAVGPHRGLNLANWCCRRGPTERTVPPPPDATGLVATLAAERARVTAARQLLVSVAIENRSATPLDLDAFVARSPVLLLEVRDAAGRQVPTVPPPTPPAQPETETLPPAGGRTFWHSMDVFSSPLPAGAYALRVRVDGIASGELPFRVGGGTGE